MKIDRVEAEGNAVMFEADVAADHQRQDLTMRAVAETGGEGWSEFISPDRSLPALG